MTKVDALIYQLREELGHRPRQFLRALKQALGDTKFQALATQVLGLWDAANDATRATVPGPSTTLPEGTLDDPPAEPSGM